MVATNDNMHDPRRPEVPTLNYDDAARDGLSIFRRVRSGDMNEHDVRDWLSTMFEAGAIAGMQAQYKHDRAEAGK